MITEFQHARSVADRKKQWVVIVVPSELGNEGRTALSALANGHSCGGRTMLLPSGGKVSVIEAPEPVFVPPSQAFYVMFVGWGGHKASDAKEMTRWRAAAKDTIQRK